MDYNHIASFLEKFKRILSQGEGVNNTIVEIIAKQVSFPVSLNMIKTKGTYIYIQGSPMLRNEILMRKEAILAEISTNILDRHFSDIR